VADIGVGCPAVGGRVMTQVVGDRFETLRGTVSGQVVVPGDHDYDEVRRVWNADIDRRPAVVVRCLTAADVSAAVLFGVTQGLEIAVRGGAHSVSGASVVDGGLMIDLGGMNQVTVDPQARRARVGGGALLGDVIEAAQEHGLAMPLGVVSHTGIGGVTLGGGMGWLSRKHGLSIDNLVGAEVVTADGRILHAAADEHPDLFWALRGGGGNFGVVTSFEFALHPVGPVIRFGLLFWPLDQGGALLRLARDVVGSLPPEVNVIFGSLSAPPAPFVPEEHQLKPGFAMLVAGFGSDEEHEGVLNQLREGLPPLWEFVTPMPYVALQELLDEANAWGQYDYDKGEYLEELTDEVIDIITEHMPRKQSPGSVMLMYRLDQAYSAVADGATAFSGGRSPRYAYFIIAICPTPELLVADRPWVRAFYDALLPHASSGGTYVNALSDGVDETRVRSAYGSKYERLAQIKQTYDPQNVFQRNANIRPAG
jgi:FAD/FMN-containing dehydrogenase